MRLALANVEHPGQRQARLLRNRLVCRSALAQFDHRLSSLGPRLIPERSHVGQFRALYMATDNQTSRCKWPNQYSVFCVQKSLLTGSQPFSIRSTSRVSFHMFLIGNLRCTSLIDPTSHSFLPSHSHHVCTLPVGRSGIPARKSGKFRADSGTGKLPTICNIPLLTADCNGKNTTNNSFRWATSPRFVGRDGNCPGKTLIREG
jgi:hypothetical protein